MLGPHSLGMEIFVLHFLYLAGPYPWDVDNVCFTFPLYVIALCMMYVYLYMLVYGWSWTLYDGLSWLHEWPSLVISAFDLIEWICAKGYYCLRYIVCMIIAMWSSRSMYQVISISSCMQYASICLTLWGAPTRPSMSMLAHTVYIGLKPYQCAIMHQIQNSAKFSPWKWGTFVAVFLWRKLDKDSVLCAMTHLSRSTVGFSPWK